MIAVSTPVPPPVREEPEKIRIWREEQEKLLKEKGKRYDCVKKYLKLGKIEWKSYIKVYGCSF